MYNREFLDTRYKVFRRDRDKNTSAKRDGGGVCLAIMKSIPYTIVERPEWQTKQVEDVWISLKPKNRHKAIHICCVYLPGEIDFSTFESFTSNITQKVNDHLDDAFIILGDFNVPSFSPIVAQPKTHKANQLDELIDCCDFEQHNQIRSRTVSKNLLDLVFSNSLLKVEASEDPLSKVDEFHPPLILTAETVISNVDAPLVNFRNFKKVNWRSLNLVLKATNWPKEFASAWDVNDKVARFYEVIESKLDSHCPTVTKKIRETTWISRKSEQLLKKKRIFHQKWKHHHNKKDYDKFSALRREANESIKADYDNINAKAEADIKTNPKAFWHFVNSKKVNGAGVAEYLKLDEKVALNKKEAADLLAEHFRSVYEDDDDNEPQQMQRLSNEDSWCRVVIPLYRILDTLKKLDIKKACGPDKLPPKLFKFCAHALSIPLHIIFNQSMKTGKFPCRWKKANVTGTF